MKKIVRLFVCLHRGQKNFSLEGSKEHFLNYRIFQRNSKTSKIFEFEEKWGRKNITQQGQRAEVSKSSLKRLG